MRNVRLARMSATHKLIKTMLWCDFILLWRKQLFRLTDEKHSYKERELACSADCELYSWCWWYLLPQPQVNDDCRNHSNNGQNATNERYNRQNNVVNLSLFKRNKHPCHTFDANEDETDTQQCGTLFAHRSVGTDENSKIGQVVALAPGSCGITLQHAASFAGPWPAETWQNRSTKINTKVQQPGTRNGQFQNSGLTNLLVFTYFQKAQVAIVLLSPSSTKLVWNSNVGAG